MEFVTRYLPSIIAVLLGLLSVFVKPLQALISAHPAVAAVLGAIYAVLAHLLPSPVKQGAN